LNRKHSNKVASAVIFILQGITPLLPLVAALLFWKRDYLQNYQQALKKIKIHVHAISAGPLQHYFQKKPITIYFSNVCNLQFIGRENFRKSIGLIRLEC
jgi:hypothetical protein